MANALNILHAFRSAYPSLDTWLSQSSKSELIVDDRVQGCIFVPVGRAQGKNRAVKFALETGGVSLFFWGTKKI